MVVGSTSLITIVLTCLVLSLVAILLSIFLLIKYLSIADRLRMFAVAINSKAVRRFLKAVEEKRSKRIRKRYLIFEVLVYGNEVNQWFSLKGSEVENAIKKSFRELFGSLALSRSGIALVYFSDRDMKGVMRFKAPYRTKLITALGYVKEVNGVRVLVIPLGISGTLKKALSKLRLKK
ncbi:MAG: hypothetical protein J7J20_05350 [Desulfurococcales archaeon]|nr:hypothetical protein [Desulfurococcales archaeon]